MKLCKKCGSLMEDTANFCIVCGNNLNMQNEKPVFGSFIKIFAFIFTIIYLAMYFYAFVFILVAGIIAFPFSGLAGYKGAGDFFGSFIHDYFGSTPILFMPPIVYVTIPAFIFSALSIKAEKRLLIFNSIFLFLNLAIFFISKFI